MLFIDATTDVNFNAHRSAHFRAEVGVIVHRGGDLPPELPSAFTSGLLDQAGRRDQASESWSKVRALANLYLRSRAARLVRVGRPDFDLDAAADLAWFKNNLTLYEFDQRDRDWSTPLGYRVVRTFWQSVWNTWFNASNDHPLDGNPANHSPTNYLPYAFANDFADVLIMELMRRPSSHADRSAGAGRVAVARRTGRRALASHGSASR